MWLLLPEDLDFLSSRRKLVNLTRSPEVGESVSFDFGCKTNGLAIVRLLYWFDADLSW